MVRINGQTLYEEPGICGTCPFLMTGNIPSPLPGTPSQRGHCILWDETHHTWAATPRRCAKLFRKAFAEYNDSNEELTIVRK